tara:strand:- start:2671 stop:3363 length:693 start_codon:yes stop_codon:yes gene_type:complete
MGLLANINNAISPSGIDSLKGVINKRGGLAKANKFAIVMTPPTNTLLNLDIAEHVRNALSGSFGLGDLVNDPRDIALLCENASLPGRQISTMDYASMQDWFTSKIPTGYLSEAVTFSFHLTGDYYIRKMFDRWQESIVSTKSRMVSYEAEYYSDVNIQQLDQNGVPIYGIKLINAFPTTVSAIVLDNNSADATQRLTVSLSYEDYVTQGALETMVGGIRNQVTGSLTRLI